MIKFDLVKKNKLKEGDYILTNGDSNGRLSGEIYGIVGHIDNETIYIFQDIMNGSPSGQAREKLKKSQFKYGWAISRKNKDCYIKKTELTPTDVLNMDSIRKMPMVL